MRRWAQMATAPKPIAIMARLTGDEPGTDGGVVTSVCTESVLFAVLGSSAADTDATAVLVSVPRASAVTTMVIVGDAVVVMNDAVVDSVQGVGLPPLKDLVAKAIENKVPIYV